MMERPEPPDFRCDGKRALVAGASSGLGLGAALALADAGAAVTLAARRGAKVAELAQEIAARGGTARAVELDIADLQAVEGAIAGQGPFDILVNSAGHARHGPALEVQAADFDAVMAVNLRGAFFLTTAVARGLIAAGRPGSLINISSQMGLVGGVDRAVYCASKHAVEGFTKAMAIELGPHGIRVNTICPTFIRTPLTAPTFAQPERVQWIENQICLGRIGTVEDIMGAVIYLASDAAALVTGTALRVDGGWTAS